MNPSSFVWLLALLALLVAPSAAPGKPLRDGIEAFRSGDYERAAEAFDQAGRGAPDDLRIVFNQGAALAAAGRDDDAVESLRRSAVSPDTEVAAKSLTLLGRIAVDRVRAQLAPEPENTPPEQRDEILYQLQIAERYYMEAKSIDPADRSIDTALEQLRSWKIRIEAIWNDMDRLRHRQRDAPERLRWLEIWQQTIGDATGQTLEEPDSPEKYQFYYETAKRQRQLTEEIVVLQKELRGQLENLYADTEPEQQRRNWELFDEELRRIHDLSEDVQRNLLAFQGKEAVDAARETAEGLNRLRINVSPFDEIAREAEKKQAVLVDANPALSRDGAAVVESAAHASLRGDPDKQVQEERRIAQWMPLMTHRAKQGLNAPQTTESTGSTDDPHATENLRAQRRAMELAVQYGPEIQTLADEAAGLLHDRAGEALPKQQRALELLREILQSLEQSPPPEQQQQGQDQQQDQDQQQGQDRQQGQDPQQGQEKQQDEQQGREPSDADEKDKDKSNEDEPKQNDRTSASKPPEKEMTPQEKKAEMDKAERMLRQVRRRQQEANEKRQRIRGMLMQAEPVEKDW